MRRFPAVILAVVLSFLGACNASPDVRDVTQIDTVDIIRNIRCETRNAVASYPPGHWIHETAIAYGFTFNAVERNGLSGGLGFAFPVAPAGKWILGLDAGVSRHREGESVVDMGEVLGNLKTLDCSTPYTPAHGYPITGQVGIRDVVDRFVAVNAFPGVLQKKFTRSLRYELRVNGGLRPSISVIPATGHVRDANLNASAERQDVHKLLIALVAPSKTPVRAPAPTKDGRRSFPEGAPPAPVVRSPGSVDRALQALDAERRLRNDELILQKLGP
jgi:hypothetical protein